MRNPDYIDNQFNKFDTAHNLKIRFTAWQGENCINTNYISITKKELEQIKAILINSKLKTYDKNI